MSNDAATTATNTAVRAPDFIHRYANQITFDLNASDIRIVFGTTENNGPNLQHTAITVTWAEAKILRYLLTQNIAVYEAFEGKIMVPLGLLPPEPSALTPEQEKDARSRTIYDAMVKLHADLLSDQKV